MRRGKNWFCFQAITSLPSPPLPRTARRLLGYLRVITSKSRTGWAICPLSEIARYFGVGQRTVSRAKALLEHRGAFVFRTISNTTGRRGHLTFVGDARATELHPVDVVGKVRHRWAHIGGPQIHLTAGPTPTPRAVVSPVKPPVKEPVKPPILTLGTNCHFPSTILEGINIRVKDTPLSGQMEKTRPPATGEGSPRAKQGLSPREKLAHWLKRECLAAWWDNCKVEAPTNNGSIYNYCLRWISNGRPIAEIIKAFDEALHEMHGTATDVGLLTGDPTMKFNVSSTLLRAGSRLTSLKGTK